MAIKKLFEKMLCGCDAGLHSKYAIRYPLIPKAGVTISQARKSLMKLLAIRLGCHKDDSQIAGYRESPTFSESTDKTTSHSTKQLKDGCQVVGYVLQTGCGVDTAGTELSGRCSESSCTYMDTPVPALLPSPPERGCCRFSDFTATAYSLRVGSRSRILQTASKKRSSCPVGRTVALN